MTPHPWTAIRTKTEPTPSETPKPAAGHHGASLVDTIEALNIALVSHHEDVSRMVGYKMVNGEVEPTEGSTSSSLGLLGILNVLFENRIEACFSTSGILLYFKVRG